MPWLLVCLLGSVALASQAQPNAIHWIFGRYAGIDFGTGCRSTQILNSAMHAREGCATVTDEYGRLFAYSNGETIWNRFHRPMPNGRNLKGHISSSQAALFVPWPGRRDSLLLFTTDAAEANGRNGLCYVVINRRADHGAGDVVSEAVVLHAPTTERLLAVAPCHRRWYWVISREYGSNRFLCYRVDEGGVNREPVVSSVGLEPGSLSTHVLGYLAVSPDGRRLALAHQGLNRVELFDFDPETGRVSRPRLVGQVASAYGVAFSPNGQLLYATTRYGQGGTGVSLFQFDLTAPTAEQGRFAVQRFDVRDTSFAGLGALQLGPDQKLYVARFNNEYLGVIHQPNRVGEACDFRPQGFYLGGRHSAFGLPNQPVIANVGCERIWTCDSVYCEGDTAQLVACSLPNARWQWFRDGQPIVGAMAPELRTTEAGRFTVQVVSGNCVWIAGPVEIRRVPLTVQLAGDTVLCPGESLVLQTRGYYQADARFEWRRDGNNIPDAHESTFKPQAPGRYSVRVSSSHCSYETQEIRVRAIEEFAAIRGDSFVCREAGVVLETPAHPDFRYRWFRDNQVLPEADGPLLWATEPGTYRVEAVYRNCSTLSPPFVLRRLQKAVQLEGRSWLCVPDDSVRLRLVSPVPVERVDWFFDGRKIASSRTSEWLARRAGRWQAVAQTANCPDTTNQVDLRALVAPTVRIAVEPQTSRPRPAYEPVRLSAQITDGRPLRWIIEEPSGALHFSGAELEHRFPGAGRYAVRLVAVNDSGCQAEARIELAFEALPLDSWLHLPNAFSPNGDGQNEAFSFSVSQLRAWHFRIFDRWNNLAYEVHSPMEPAWDGRLRWGGIASEGVYIYDLQGQTHSGEHVRRCGSLTLIR